MPASALNVCGALCHRHSCPALLSVEKRQRGGGQRNGTIRNAQPSLELLLKLMRRGLAQLDRALGEDVSNNIGVSETLINLRQLSILVSRAMFLHVRHGPNVMKTMHLLTKKLDTTISRTRSQLLFGAIGGPNHSSHVVSEDVRRPVHHLPD
eukprot:1661298-Pyramimonas_sp.AAC.1